jgi:hypothetical protein
MLEIPGPFSVETSMDGEQYKYQGIINHLMNKKNKEYYQLVVECKHREVTCNFIIDFFGNNVGPERVWLSYMDAPGLAMTRSMGDKVGA